MNNIKKVLRSILFVLGFLFILWEPGRFLFSIWLVELLVCQPGDQIEFNRNYDQWYCGKVPVDGILDKIEIGAIIFGVVLLAIWYITGPPQLPKFFKKILEKMDNQNPVLNGLIAGLVTGFMVFLMMLSVGYFGEMTVFYLLMILGICAIPGIVGGVLGGLALKTTLGEIIGGSVVSLITIIVFIYLNT